MIRLQPQRSAVGASVARLPHWRSSAEEPLPLWFFSEIVYHELMHHYTLPVQPVSQLRKKYANESLTTQNHLHVMAMEKLALIKLGKEAELRYLDRRLRLHQRTSALGKS
jgi:hypothetical protein